MNNNVMAALARVDQSRVLDINLKACQEFRDKILENLKPNDDFYFYETQFMSSGGVCFRYCLNGENKTVFFDHQPKSSELNKYINKNKPTKSPLTIPVFALILLIISIAIVLLS